MSRTVAQSDLRILIKRRNVHDEQLRKLTRRWIHAVIRAVRATPQEAS
jgi:hypothetical protein